MSSVLLITGSLPPDICGVGDYTALLADALTTRNHSVELFCRSNWRLWKLASYKREIEQSSAKVINLQYPTAGYGKSLVPHLLTLSTRGKRKTLTLHEFSRGSVAGKLAMCLFFLSADHVIFTSDDERLAAQNWAPWIQHKSSTIHIGSNIPFHNSATRDIDVVYFGHIAPGRGLEQFSEAILSLDPARAFNLCLVGQIAAGHEDYGHSFCDALRSRGVKVMLNRPAQEVADLLSRSRIALLPFPDGLSLRRGSALAAMGNGALLLTTAPASNRTAFRDICLMAGGRADLHTILNQALDHYEEFDHIRVAGNEFARSRSWEQIALAYGRVLFGEPLNAS